MSDRPELLHRLIECTNLQDKFPNAVFVEYWSSDPTIQAKWEKYGFIAVSPLLAQGIAMHDNGIPRSICGVDETTPYGVAFGMICTAAENKAMPADSPNRALRAMYYGVFDESEFIRFLPRQI